MDYFNNRGFTVMELLVTIAVIGVLASVILMVSSGAREDAIEAKIKGEMNSLAKQAAISESKLKTYNAVCGINGSTQDEKVAEIIASIQERTTGTFACNSNDDAYAASIPLVSDHWCVDSGGESKEILVAITTELECP